VCLHLGDVCGFEFPKGEFSYVLHAATEAVVQPTRKEMLETSIGGTRRTLEFAKACGARRFLLTSSGAVYGRQPADMTHVPETYTPSPEAVDAVSAYAEGKRRAELLCAEMTEGTGIAAAIARCWAFCGAHLALDAHFAVGNFIRDCMAGQPIAIGGDGTPRRSYLYAADLAAWLWTMLLRAPALLPINVGSGCDLSIRELAETVARVLVPGTEIRVAKQAIEGASPARYVPSVDRARELLGLRETVDLEEQIRRTAEWYGFSIPRS
jgi:dTDP-glucose 4,6-dehydratase